MRKIYMSPVVEIIDIAPCKMIAASLVLNRGRIDDDEVDDESELLSRGYQSVWDEFEE